MSNFSDITNKKLIELAGAIDKNSEKVFLVSDTHFNDLSMLESEPSRLICQDSFESFEEFLAYNWNNKVSKNDFVLHLGDFISKDTETFFNKFKLNGRIILIRGNHDRDDILSAINDKFYLIISELIWLKKEGTEYSVEVINSEDSRPAGLITECRGKRILFSHYPVYEYDEYDIEEVGYLREIFEKNRCNLNIHGHVHSKLEMHPALVNASVERIDFTPKRLSDLV